MPESKTSIVVHGGAGTISKKGLTPTKERNIRNALIHAVFKGNQILERGGTAVNAVTEAVAVLEDCEYFNAGKGSVFTHDGDHEMDAAIMDGRNGRVGSVSSVRLVKNPIHLAKMIMQKSKHVILSGQGAMEFALSHNITLEDKDYFYTEERYNQWLKARKSDQVALDHDVELPDKKFGTVGAVARDKKGNLAAATSTGGMTNKRFGRIGDSPIPGAGTFASNNTCAVSCTGHGEFFLRTVAAHQVSILMEYAGLSLEDSCHAVIKKIVGLGGRGGMIGVDHNGNMVMDFSTKGMYRAWKCTGQDIETAIYK